MTATISRFRTIPMLTILCGALLATYVALMVATILFASLQTQLSQSMQDERMKIAKLEGQYFEALSSLDTADPRALGYVTPTHVTYVTEAALPNVAFAR